MKKTKIKAKILGMTYEPEDYIFIIDVLDTDRNEKVSLAMRIEDFGITRKVKMPNGEVEDIPEEMMFKFCGEMIGKERNLTVIQDNNKGNKEKPSYSDMVNLQHDMDEFPYKELIRKKLNEG